MAASDHLQLKMFMSPREIGSTIDAYGDFGPNPGGLPHEAMRSIGATRHSLKETNLAASGMGDSVRAEGVRKPIDIAHTKDETFLNNGHHRVLAQSKVDPDRLMPVIHTSYDDPQYHGRDSQGFQREGLAYKTFNMWGSQDGDPAGTRRGEDYL